MKIIITITTLLSILTMSVYAESSSGVFNFKIPQLDIISNDWDGDGIPNSQDNDDDNDGIDDVDDSLPFGHNGKNSSSLIIFNSFTSDKSDISSGDTINLSWDIDNKQNLNIYTDSNLIELVQDVSDLNSLELSPSETTTYYLDYGAGIADITIEVLQVPSAEGSSYTVYTSVLGTSIGNVSFSRMSQSYYQNSSYDSSINMSFTTTHSANNGYVYKYGIIEITFPSI